MSLRRLTAVVVAAAVSVGGGFAAAAAPAVAAEPPVAVTVNAPTPGSAPCRSTALGRQRRHLGHRARHRRSRPTCSGRPACRCCATPAAPTPTSTTGATTPRPAATSRRTPTSTRSWRRCGATGAQPMVIANYGTGTAAGGRRLGALRQRRPRTTASSTGRSATRTTATATTARPGRPTTTPTRARPQYATTWCAYADAMKAVDPTIKIGAVLTTPGNWPDGIVGRRRRRHLEPGRAVRSPARPSTSSIVHWYPGGDTAAEALAKTGPDRRRGLPAARSRSPGTPARTPTGSASR